MISINNLIFVFHKLGFFIFILFFVLVYNLYIACNLMIVTPAILYYTGFLRSISLKTI